MARTDRSHPFFSRTKPEHLQLLRDVLLTYCMYDFDLGLHLQRKIKKGNHITGYVQGMSDFISVLCVILRSEVDIFWCLVGLMEIVVFLFYYDESRNDNIFAA